MGSNYTYTMLTNLMNLSVGSGAGYDISAINAELVIDLAINCLNLFGASLSNMTGTAGSKTVTLEPAEHAAISLVARAIYYSFHKSLVTVGVGGLSLSTSDLLKDPATLQLIKDCALQLKAGAGSDEDSGMQVLTG